VSIIIRQALTSSTARCTLVSCVTWHPMTWLPISARLYVRVMPNMNIKTTTPLVKKAREVVPGTCHSVYLSPLN